MDASEQLRLAAKRARERKDLRQEDVAAQLQQLGINITSNAYAKFEGGTRGGKFDEVAAIAQVLELDLTAITRSVKTDVIAWISKSAEDRYRADENALEMARLRFTSSSQAINAVRDLERALGGETVEVNLNARAFASMTLLPAVEVIPNDLADFFESQGDGGKVRSAVEGYNPDLADEPQWEGNKMHFRGGRGELVGALAEALEQTVPNLKFQNYV